MTTYPKKPSQQQSQQKPQQGQTVYANRTPQQPQQQRPSQQTQPSQPQQQRKPQPPQGPQQEEKKEHLPYLNILCITGRLGEDPQLTQINGRAVYKFSLACWQSREKPTIWLKVYVYSPELHETVSSLKKGQEVQVVGKFTYDVYQETVQLGMLANDISLTPLCVSVDPLEE